MVVLQLAEFLLLVSADSVLTCLRLFLCREFHNVVHDRLAVHRFANLYLVLVIEVYGLPENLSVRETVATAFLHVVQNVGHAFVYVLGRVAVILRKKRIFLRTLFQIRKYPLIPTLWMIFEDSTFAFRSGDKHRSRRIYGK